MEQVLNSLTLQRLKFFNQLENVVTLKNTETCCSDELSEDDLENLHQCFENWRKKIWTNFAHMTHYDVIGHFGMAMIYRWKEEPKTNLITVDELC